MADIASGEMKANPMAGNMEAVEAVKAGAIVYKKRSKLVLCIMGLFVAWGLTSVPLLYCLASLVIMMVVVDFFGAVTHGTIEIGALWGQSVLASLNRTCVFLDQWYWIILRSSRTPFWAPRA